jgi:hypothetical protein
MSTKSILLKTGGALTLAFAVVAGGNWVVSPRVTQQEAAMRISQGQLTDAHVKPGVLTDWWRPGVHYLRLPTTLEKTSVHAGEADAVTIRTKENSRIYGNFEVHFRIDNTDKNFDKAYTELKVNSIDDIKPFINNYVIPSAIDVYQQIPVLDVNKNQPKIGNDIKTKLQGYLDDHGYTYIRILDVIPSGVGLSKDANDMLEQIVKEERKKTLLETQGQVADMAKDITDKQTVVSLEAINKFKAAGLTGQEAIELYYLQLMHVNDQLGRPNVPGPIPGTGVGSLPSPGK